MQKLKLEDMKRSNIQAPFIKFEQKAPSRKQTLTLEGIDKRYGRNEVIQPFGALVARAARRSASSARTASARPQP